MRLQATFAAAGGALLWWRIGGPVCASVFGFFSALAVIAWLLPRHFEPVQRVFDFLTHLLVAGASWVLLAAVYFGVFAPLRLWFCLRGKDLLQRRPSTGAQTNLSPLPGSVPEHFNRQY